jgi:porin
MKAIALTLGLAGAICLPVAAQAQTVSGKSTDTGPLSDFGEHLDDMGIRLRSQLVDEYADNPTGGVHQGDRNVGQFQFGASFDFGKIIGLDGGALHVTFVRDYGHGLSHDVTGTFTKSQEIYKNEFNISRLGVFAYEQKLFHDRLDIFVGRLGSTTFYGRLTNSCYFQSGLTCSVPQVLNSSAGFTFPTSATWGGNVRYHLGRDMYVEAGAFEVNSFIQQTNGFDFSTKHATGFTVPFEISKGDYDLDHQRYPGTIKVGGYVSTPQLNDIAINTKGQSLGLFGGAPRPSDQMRSGLYIMGEKAVWRPSDNSPQSLALFGGWIRPLDNQEVMTNQAYVGAALRAPLPGREHDILSFVANWYRLSDAERDFLRDSRIKAGGSGINKPNEYAFEMDYSALLYRSVRVGPNIQYIVNPDNSSLPKTAAMPKNVVVIGVKFTINLTGLLGLPLAPNLSD